MAYQILIVDDSKSVLRMLNHVLTNAGYTVLEAIDAEHAIVTLMAKPCDLVITDINMPGKDGFELVQAIRQMKDYTATPVLVMTQESDEEKKKRGKEVGATGWIVKPFNPEYLLQIIARLLENK